jgi:regulator of sigma E protease
LDKPEPMHRDEVKPDAGSPPPTPRLDTSTDKAPPPSPSLSSREWWVQNGPVLIIVIAVLVFLFMKFDLEGLLAILKAALGLGLVVFLHELGHFLAAKWCDVHVTAFSIGFGPAIPGCSVKWGETSYKLALFPLGGYVQMVGQVDGDETSDGSEDDPRSFRNKTVGQRMLIISAGVIMNVILAVVCFVVVFRGPGKERMANVVGAVDPGAPAFTKGIRSGAKITQIGNVKNPFFENLMARVTAAGPGEEIEFDYQVSGDPKEYELKIKPRNEKDKGDQKNLIGLAPASSTELLSEKYGANSKTGPTKPNSTASRAQPSFKFGDKIIATTDPDDPSKMKDLPPDPRFTQDARLPKQDRRDFFELAKRLQLLAGKTITLRVQHENGKEENISLPPSFYQTLGVRMQMGHITNVRENSPAAKAGVLVSRKNEIGALLHGDLIQSVKVSNAEGETITYDEKNLDPERLLFQLRQWAKGLEEKKVPGPWKVTLTVSRHEDFAPGSPVTFQPKTLELDWDNGWRFERMTVFPYSPLAIPELGLAYQIKSIVAEVIPGLIKDNPLKQDDAIKEVLSYPKDSSEAYDAKVTLKAEDEQWASVANFLQQYPGKKIVLKITRDGKPEEVTIHPVADENYPSAETGMEFESDSRLQIADSNLQAIGMGLSDTWDNMSQVFHTLRGMIIYRNISPFQMAGPLTIARLAYKIAGMDFWEFVFFLGMISVNLAVINFLPIPVLDGGHMVFLIYEKLRGKPASEGIRNGATIAGLALILCLMVFVIYVDVSRWF